MSYSVETTRERHCRALELPDDRDLGVQEVRDAWRRANLQWHPNRPGGNATKHTEVSKAYEALRNDLTRPRPSSPPPPPPVSVPIPIAAPAPPPDLTSHPPLAYQAGTVTVSESNKPYSVRWHDGRRKLCLELGVPLRTLVEGGRVTFQHLDGKEYGLGSSPGGWGGWAELPGLGLTPGDSLIVIFQPLFPRFVPPKARELIVQGLELCDPDHSLILQELMPELTR